MSALPYRYLALEGPIGVGKTTLARALAARLDARLVLEKPEENPFLPRFYEEGAVHALPTQLSFLFARYRELLALRQGELFAGGLISDYIFEKDRIFASLNLSDGELALYDRLEPVLRRELARPELVLYLRASPRALMTRIRRRSISYEAHISPEYLARLAERYEEFFRGYKDSPLLVVDTESANPAGDQEDLARLVARLAQLPEGRSHYP